MDGGARSSVRGAMAGSMWRGCAASGRWELEIAVVRQI